MNTDRDRRAGMVFLGSKESGAHLLSRILEAMPSSISRVITFDDTQDSRSALSKFESIAKGRGVECRVVGSPQEANELLIDNPCRMCIVMGWYWLLPPEVLATASEGFIGVHYSLLPRYRGSSPLVWTMINGEAEAGFSIFVLGHGTDDGPVWAQGSVPIRQSDYIGDVLGRLDERASDSILSVILDVLHRRRSPWVQDEAAATYCAARLPTDGEIAWHEPAQRVYDSIRAQSHPYPGAYSWADGERVTVWRARLFNQPFVGTPGQVARVTPDGVWVVAGDDRAVVVEEVGDASGRVLPADALLRTTRLRLGSTI